MATAVHPRSTVLGASRPASRAPALPARLRRILDGLNALRQAELLLFGAPPAARGASQDRDVITDVLETFWNRKDVRTEDHVHAVLYWRHREEADVLALRNGVTLAARFTEERWRVVAQRCAACGLPVVNPTADGGAGRFCTATCRAGVTTEVERQAIVAALNFEFNGRSADGTPPELARWWEGREELYRPGFGVEDLDYALAPLPGIDWARTWALRAQLPETIAVFALIDGLAAVQDACDEWRVEDLATVVRPFLPEDR